MKKVLVTGASGYIGTLVIKFLLSEGKYDITALDLKNKKSLMSLKKYKKRINIVLGDVTDPILMDALIKDTDYVIHLAGVMPPLVNVKDSLFDMIDYKGTENIVRAIEFYNKKCNLIFASTTSIYSTKKNIVSVDTSVGGSIQDFYSNGKLKLEKLITSRLKNYIIFRLPLVLTDLNKSNYIYTGKGNFKLEVISDMDAAYAFVSALNNIKKLNGKKFNLSGGEGCVTTYYELLTNIYKYYGVGFNYFFTRLFAPKYLNGFVYSDGNELDDILHFRNDSIESFIMRNKRSYKNRAFNILLAKPLIYKLKKELEK